jgi:broad specificity phosphatase PhoE
VFFVRHGESRWNEAQREMHLSAMAKFDHPLNTRGAGQATRAGAEAARHQRSAEGTRSDASDADPFDAFASANATDAPRVGFVPAGHGGDAPRLSANQLAWWRSFGDATRCFSSPLTRAAQTAALFLFASGKTAKAAEDPAAARKKKDEPFVVLSRSLREVKSTMGSLDTIGIERGADGILRRAAEKLRDACHGGVPDAAYADAAVAAMRAETDAGDAFGRWWTSRDDVDSREQMDERVDDFFETLRLEASDAVIVVGHSLWFQHAIRRLCAREGSRAFAERDKDAARTLTSEKIGNCACVGLALTFDAATGEASLEDAAFLLGGGEAE